MQGIRKLVSVSEQTFEEGGRAVDPPITMAAAMAVMRNPWAGRGYVEDLQPEIRAVAPELADLLVGELLRLIPVEDVEAYGKAAVVGVDGEIEHASAMIHTLRFGNVFRDAVGGTSFLSFTNKRGGPGTSITMPLIHKNDEGRRSHFITFETSIVDAPRADELVVAIAASTGGRAHPRIGDRRIDMAEMGLTPAHT